MRARTCNSGSAAAAPRRGTIYLLILVISSLVTIIGLSAMALARVERRAAGTGTDLIEARILALSAVDIGLRDIQQDPGAFDSAAQANPGSSWDMRTAESLGNGTITIVATGPNNDNQDPKLTGIGEVGAARYKLQVELDASHQPITGTWRQRVDP
jgi:Tfp pilus assembly protein PilX